MKAASLSHGPRAPGRPARERLGFCVEPWAGRSCPCCRRVWDDAAAQLPPAALHWTQHTRPAQSAARLCQWFPWARKGRGAGQRSACSAQQRACTQTPERKPASPTGARGAHAVCTDTSRCTLRVAAHRTLKIRLKGTSQWGRVESRINTQEGVSPPSPREIHVPVKRKAAHRGRRGAQAGEGVGGGHLCGLQSPHPAVRHTQALTLEDRGDTWPRVSTCDGPTMAWLGPATGQSENEIARSYDNGPRGAVMPKSRNLPMTTREPVSDAKARELLLPSSSWGSHRY